jgi:purine-cytosine permease-like protein
MFDAAARHLDYPLLKALDALLIFLLALAWIVPIEWAWLAADWDMFGNNDETNISTWPAYIGVIIGAELGLVLLMLVSVTLRLILRRT